ncbi:MAG: 4Fe-4S binding protein [Acidaminococcaceae bacterium]|nr:4Fe-4S binding protein [Acidaminococcaceae bacterium]MDD4722980.1 4Fe-4S binding protein [Acidaminococcaceae bacterium]
MDRANYQQFQEYQANRKKQKYIQRLRRLIQLVFLALLIAGLHKTVKSIFVIFLVASFVFGNYFCGWVCPFGTMQEYFSKIGSMVCKEKIKMPRGKQHYLQFSRYCKW